MPEVGPIRQGDMDQVTRFNHSTPGAQRSIVEVRYFQEPYVSTVVESGEEGVNCGTVQTWFNIQMPCLW